MTRAAAVIEEIDARKSLDGGYSIQATAVREIPAMATQAAQIVTDALAPLGAEGYKSGFVFAYRDRASLDGDFIAALDALGPFRLCLVNPAPAADAYCASRDKAQTTRDSRLAVWRRSLTDLRTRYNSWLVTQGH